MPAHMGKGNSRADMRVSAREATVTCCGVAVALGFPQLADGLDTESGV